MAVCNGRDGKGRFSVGNRYGHGNPRLKEVGEYREAIRKAFSAKAVVAVLAAVGKAALEGSVPAAALWLSYIVGKPHEFVTIETMADPAEIGRAIAEWSAQMDATIPTTPEPGSRWARETP